jgi:uncharacterized protein YndB with AHSA1/START domain
MPVATPRRRPRKPSTSDAKLNRISSGAVERATGKGWDLWLRILDRAGAASMPHPEIAALLHARHGVGEWWSQMVTVGYEQARGLRKRHQRPGGYAVSGSKTVGVPLAGLYRAWAEPELRARWLGEGALEVRRATPNKSMRITWEPGEAATSVEVSFYAKGHGKSQVTVDHGKLKTAAAGERMKRLWRGKLEKLKELLEA